jgi:trimethylamine--corrinoid protein Co-methyltransferase
MNRRALGVFQSAGADVDHGTMTVRLDRGLVAEALKTAPSSYELASRNPARQLMFGGNIINFTLVAGPPNVHDFERGRRAGNLRDYHELVSLAQHFNCIHMLGNQVCAPIELPANTRHLDTYFANLTLTDKPFHVSAIGRGQGAGWHHDDGDFARALSRGSCR